MKSSTIEEKQSSAQARVASIQHHINFVGIVLVVLLILSVPFRASTTTLYIAHWIDTVIGYIVIAAFVFGVLLGINLLARKKQAEAHIAKNLIVWSICIFIFLALLSTSIIPSNPSGIQ